MILSNNNFNVEECFDVELNRNLQKGQRLLRHCQRSQPAGMHVPPPTPPTHTNPKRPNPIHRLSSAKVADRAE